MSDDLIVRLESATEGSDELSLAVHNAANPKGAIPPEKMAADDRLWIFVQPCTTSLDAAVSMVPDRHDWEVSCEAGFPCKASVWKSDPSGRTRPLYEGRSATAPLALCIAARRALSR